MTLVLLLTGVSTRTPSTTATANVVFGVCGPTVQAIFPINTVVSSYAAITFPTN